MKKEQQPGLFGSDQRLYQPDCCFLSDRKTGVLNEIYEISGPDYMPSSNFSWGFMGK